MKKKNFIVWISICLCIVLIAAAVLISQGEGEEESKVGNLAAVKESFQTDIQELKDGKYTNLTATDFTASIEDVEGVYNLEILSDNSYQNRTNQEKFKLMDELVDKFFQGNIDKSYLVAELYLYEEESVVEIGYDDVENVLSDKQYSEYDLGSLFGSDDEDTYYVQITPSLKNTWFSKRTFGTVLPGGDECEKAYPYVSGIRQEDAVLNLMDGEIQLSELEKRVLNYLHGDDFPLPTSEGIRYGIGTTQVMEYEEYQSISFIIRRIYKGVPFEYGSQGASGGYIDKLPHDFATLNYAVSTSPDTLMGFRDVNGTVVEMEHISEMLTAGGALNILSEKIGENSIYEVHGVELVYRNCEIPEERQSELDDILVPKWKIITINQNDDKYTLFYVDVVTGEVTERFEYYYD